MPKKIDLAALPRKVGTRYPAPHYQHTKGRQKVALGDAAGLTQFGVNLTTLPPGTWSALPHWHEKEDEFVYILSGTPTLVSGAESEELAPGDCVGFKAGEEIGHCLKNLSDSDVVILEVGSRIADERAFYPGLDLMADTADPALFLHLDGTPYEDIRRRGPDDD